MTVDPASSESSILRKTIPEGPVADTTTDESAAGPLRQPDVVRTPHGADVDAGHETRTDQVTSLLDARRSARTSRLQAMSYRFNAITAADAPSVDASERAKRQDKLDRDIRGRVALLADSGIPSDAVAGQLMELAGDLVPFVSDRTAAEPHRHEKERSSLSDEALAHLLGFRFERLLQTLAADPECGTPAGAARQTFYDLLQLLCVAKAQLSADPLLSRILAGTVGAVVNQVASAPTFGIPHTPDLQALGSIAQRIDLIDGIRAQQQKAS